MKGCGIMETPGVPTRILGANLWVCAPWRARVPREPRAPHRRSTRPAERPDYRVAVTLYKPLLSPYYGSFHDRERLLPRKKGSKPSRSWAVRERLGTGVA